MAGSAHRIVSSTLRRELQRLSRASSERKAAVAYVTSDQYVEFKEDDLLVVDASDMAIACGETDREVLTRAFSRGVRLYSLPDLHAKLFVFDDTAVIGSANLSE